jgi:hypothetical protein
MSQLRSRNEAGGIDAEEFEEISRRMAMDPYSGRPADRRIFTPDPRRLPPELNVPAIQPEGEEVPEGAVRNLPPVETGPHLVVAETLLSRAAEVDEPLNWREWLKTAGVVLVVLAAAVFFGIWSLPHLKKLMTMF